MRYFISHCMYLHIGVRPLLINGLCNLRQVKLSRMAKFIWDQQKKANDRFRMYLCGTYKNASLSWRCFDLFLIVLQLYHRFVTMVSRLFIFQFCAL